jgi:hypothetical protein
MTDHNVTIEGTFEFICSCGEELGGYEELPVTDALNIRWQHLMEHMTPIPPEPASEGVTFPLRDWKNWRVG